MSKFILLYISFKSNMLFRDLSTGNFLVTAVVLVAPVDTFLFVLLRILLSCSPQVFTKKRILNFHNLLNQSQDSHISLVCTFVIVFCQEKTYKISDFVFGENMWCGVPI